ncbi:hypothetical protein [Pontibacter kalidii]|uniref:hypothetical protein n=1 Tax=Pontibacter kalidii TaxID=2592049 RepID=UPI00225058DA|nr:hypothetical protein [Pontibacter kalidii]
MALFLLPQPLIERQHGFAGEDVLGWFGGWGKYKWFHQENAADFTSIAPHIEEEEL